MKLEEGMYVRFDNVICKILEIEFGMIEFDEFFYDHWNESICNMEYDRFVKDYKPKTSYNIIDLIEVGDYVNGCYVTNLEAQHNECLIIVPKRVGIIKCNAHFNQGNYNDCEFVWIEEKDIKSIVTKEQMESMEYKL